MGKIGRVLVIMKCLESLSLYFLCLLHIPPVSLFHPAVARVFFFVILHVVHPLMGHHILMY